MGKWVKALKSGKFDQAEGTQFDGRAYCCLGIRQVIEGVQFRPILGDGSVMDWQDDEGKIEMPSPFRLASWGLNEPLTEDETARLMREIPESNSFLLAQNRFGERIYRFNLLAHLNDRGVTFPVIANIIEQFGWDNSDNGE